MGGLWRGLLAGVGAGLVAGILGPFAYSLWTGAFWLSPVAGWLGLEAIAFRDQLMEA